MAKLGNSYRLRRTVQSQKRRSLTFELLDQRRVLASLSGQVFLDADESLRKNDAEVGLANRVVYIDLNDNSMVDRGEPIELTDASGRFKFDNLSVGDYVIRLFNGTDSQQQNVPFRPEAVGLSVDVEDAFTTGAGDFVGMLGDEDLYSYNAAGRLISEIDLSAGASRIIELDGLISGLQKIGSRQVLAYLSADPENLVAELPAAVVVSFDDGLVTPLLTDVPLGSDGIHDLAIAANGAGFFIAQPDGQTTATFVRFALDSGLESWTTTISTIELVPNSQVLASASGPIALVAQPSDFETLVSLVSSVSDGTIPDSAVALPGHFHFLAFDDSAGLAVARDDQGAVFVFDTANSFQVLRTLSDWDGNLVLDGHRELLFGMMGNGDLEIYDIVEGSTIGSLPLGMELGPAVGIALSDGGNRVSVRRGGLVEQVRIDRLDAHRVSIGSEFTGVEFEKDLLFGMLVTDDNLVPEFTTAPNFETLEDQTLIRSTPGLIANVPNPEVDTYLALQISQPSHGVAIVQPNGSLTYVPNANYFGTDSFEIMVTDGRDNTAPTTVTIDVLPVDDLPAGIRINLPPIPENTIAPAIVGTIEIDDVDGDIYVVTINEPRLQVQGGQIIFVGPEFDAETEPSISIVITVTNPENDLDTESVSTVLTIEDTDDPPTDVLPHDAAIIENETDEEIAILSLVDPDSSSGYSLTVSDPRFTILGRALVLVEPIEAEPGTVIALTVQVRDADNSLLLSSVINVTLAGDSGAIDDIRLTGRSLPEQASGYVVGSVQVLGSESGQEYSLGVDDTRFEIVDSRLKLRDGVYVRRADQAEILVTITASMVGAAGTSFSKDFVLNVIANEVPHHNQVSPTDVDNDGVTRPIDALIIINSLNHEGPRDLIDPIAYESERPRFYDVNGDGRITPIDALIVINRLNRDDDANSEPGGGGGSATGGEGEGEGDPASMAGEPLGPIPAIPVAKPFKDVEEDRRRRNRS